MRVHHYSERGLVNAWVQAMASKDDDSLLLAFLDKAFSIDTGTRLSGPLSNLGRPLDIDLYVEPSLSEFGNPDAVILVKGNEGGCAAIFVEAKLCPFFCSSSSSKADDTTYRKNASTILHELYMKASLHKALQGNKNFGALTANVYADETKPRKLGRDPQVLALAERLAGCQPYFLALTTDPSREASEARAIRIEDPFIDHIESYWLAWSAQVKELASEVEKQNQPPSPLPTSKKGLDFSNPNLGAAFREAAQNVARRPYYENLFHLSWTDIFFTAKEHSQNELLKAIQENRGKLTYPLVSLPKDEKENKGHTGECLQADPTIVAELDAFWSLHNLKRRDRDSTTRWTLYPLKGGKNAFATGSLLLAHDGLYVGLYLIQRARKKSTDCQLVISYKQIEACTVERAKLPLLSQLLDEHLTGAVAS